MESTTIITAFERTFFEFTALGLLAYIYKKLHAFPTWNLLQFWKENGANILTAAMLSLGIGWFVPDLILLAPEKLQLTDMAAKNPRLVEKLTWVFGTVLGYSGGSIGFDLIALLYGMPIIGGFLKTIVEKLKAQLGIKPPPAPPGTVPANP